MIPFLLSPPSRLPTLFQPLLTVAAPAIPATAIATLTSHRLHANVEFKPSSAAKGKDKSHALSKNGQIGHISLFLFLPSVNSVSSVVNLCNPAKLVPRVPWLP